MHASRWTSSAQRLFEQTALCLEPSMKQLTHFFNKDTGQGDLAEWKTLPLGCLKQDILPMATGQAVHNNWKTRLDHRAMQQLYATLAGKSLPQGRKGGKRYGHGDLNGGGGAMRN